jgi:hypothetical protein
MPAPTVAASVADRIAALDWPALTAQLDDRGFAQTEPVLDAAECAALAAQFDDGRFRSRVDMRRHRFGEGEYKYFDAPLPALVDAARHALYPPLAALANDWAGRLGEEAGYPAELDEFLARCHAGGQTRPTPLILRYFEGGHNTLHQDLYGDLAFPLQAVTALNRAGTDFAGGQFVLLAPGRRLPRPLPDDDAPWRRDGPQRGADHARDHLPRRGLTRTLCKASFAKR